MKNIRRVLSQLGNHAGDIVLKSPAFMNVMFSESQCITVHLMLKGQHHRSPHYMQIELAVKDIYVVGPYLCDTHGTVFSWHIPAAMVPKRDAEFFVVGWSPVLNVLDKTSAEPNKPASLFTPINNTVALEPVMMSGGTWDIFSPRRCDIPHGATLAIGCGYGVNIPEGYLGILSLRKRYGIKGAICGATFIHAGYEGEITIQVTNASNDLLEIIANEPLLQLAIVPLHGA